MRPQALGIGVGIGHLLDPGHGLARLDGLEDRIDAAGGLVHQLVPARIGRPDGEAAAEVHVIAVQRGAEVDVHDVASLEAPMGGGAVVGARARPRAHHGADARIAAAVAHQCGGKGRVHVGLAQAGLEGVARRRHRQVGDPARLAHDRQLARRLDEPHVLDQGRAVGDRGDLGTVGRGVGQALADRRQQRGMGSVAPGLERDAALGPAARPDRLGHQRHVTNRRAARHDDDLLDVRRRGLEHDVAVVVEEQRRLLVGPQEDTDDVEVRMPDLVVAGEIVHVGRPGHEDAVDPFPRHGLAHLSAALGIFFRRERLFPIDPVADALLHGGPPT